MLYKTVCIRILQGITAEVEKQAEQRTNSRFVMYVLSIEKYSKGSTLWKICRITKTLEFIEETQLRNDREALIYVASATERVYYREHNKGVQPNQG